MWTNVGEKFQEDWSRNSFCRPSEILNCHQNVIRLLLYIYFICLGFVKCYMITYFSVMLQNNYFLEYFIFYIRLLPTEEAVQRYPAKKCLKGFSKINRKQVFSCTFLEHIEKLSYRTPAKKVASILPLVKFFKEHQFAVIFSPTFGTTTLWRLSLFYHKELEILEFFRQLFLLLAMIM